MVSNGQPVNAATVNNAFVSKTVDSTVEADITLADPDISPAIDSAQSYINEIADTVGLTEGDATRKDYSSNNFIINGDNRKVAIGKLDTQLKLTNDRSVTNETDIGNIEIDVNDHENRILTLETDVGDHETRITDIENDIGQPNGIAQLDGTGRVPAGQLPSFVDDVLEFADFASLPVTGEEGKIYITLDDNKTYRWSGTTYVLVGGGDVTGPATSTTGAIARYDGTTGKLLRNSSVILEDSGIFGFTVENNNVSGVGAEITTLSAAIVRLINASLASIDMIVNLSSGREFTLVNVTGNDIEINNDTGATAARRILTGTGDSIVLANEASIKLQYDQTLSRWRIVGGSGSGGAGGSGSFEWLTTGDYSPVEKIVDGMKFFGFDGESGHEIYGVFKVPSTYKVGKPITMNGLEFYCSLASGNIFFKAQTALLIPGLTVIGTYPNIHNSTNSQVALSVANQIESVGVIDLTDSSGQINSVSVNPGDTLRIRLFRDFASETSGPYLVDANLNQNTASIEVQ